MFLHLALLFPIIANKDFKDLIFKAKDLSFLSSLLPWVTVSSSFLPVGKAMSDCNSFQSVQVMIITSWWRLSGHVSEAGKQAVAIRAWLHQWVRWSTGELKTQHSSCFFFFTVLLLPAGFWHCFLACYPVSFLICLRGILPTVHNLSHLLCHVITLSFSCPE